MKRERTFDGGDVAQPTFIPVKNKVKIYNITQMYKMHQTLSSSRTEKFTLQHYFHCVICVSIVDSVCIFG